MAVSYFSDKSTVGIQSNKDRNSKGFVIWFYGLSGSGKSTLANELELALHQKGVRTYLLDGDRLRTGLNRDLGFTEADRSENIRRSGEVAKLFVEAGMVVLGAFITPMKKDRELLRSIIGNEQLLTVFVNCPLEICEQRDVKGLYAKARRGEIKNFTGIDAPFEVSKSDIIVHTNEEELGVITTKLLNLIKDKV